MSAWFQDHQALTWWLGTFSVLSFFGTLLLIPFLVVRIKPDYFTRTQPPEGWWKHYHPAWRILLLVLKNLVGLVFVLAGVTMLVLPGQGLLTILVGLLFLNFPGKRALERRFVCVSHINRTLNWLRRRAGKEPLQLPCNPGET